LRKEVEEDILSSRSMRQEETASPGGSQDRFSHPGSHHSGDRGIKGIATLTQYFSTGSGRKGMSGGDYSTSFSFWLWHRSSGFPITITVPFTVPLLSQVSTAIAPLGRQLNSATQTATRTPINFFYRASTRSA
jgi:hypothetical protein